MINLLRFLMISKFHKDIIMDIFTLYPCLHIGMSINFMRRVCLRKRKKNTKLTLTVGKYLVMLAPRITSSFQFDIFTLFAFIYLSHPFSLYAS